MQSAGKKFQKPRCSRKKPKNRCDQVIWDPIQNRVAARFALNEAALFEALLYKGFFLSSLYDQLALCLAIKTNEKTTFSKGFFPMFFLADSSSRARALMRPQINYGIQQMGAAKRNI